MKRIVFLDYVRVIACFMVMLVHASENYYGAPGSTMAEPLSTVVSEADRFWVAVYDGCCRMAVPLFMIVSAFLLVPMKEGQSAGQFYKKRALRILPPFLIFMILYCTVPFFTNDIDGDASAHFLSRLLLNFPDTAGHLWFIYPLLGLYLFIPIISPWLAKVSAKEERFFIILFAISTCMPYLNRFFGDVWGQCFWNQFHTLWYFSGYLGYLVMAHYIRVHLNWSYRKRIVIGTSMMIIGAIWTVLSFYIQAVPGKIISTPVLEIGWSFCIINVLLLTAGFFILCTCIKREKTPKFILQLSELSYGMYLMHIFWLGLWAALFKTELELPTGIAIPVMALATFVSCWASTLLISYLPGGKWVVGTSSFSRKTISLSHS